MHRRLFMGAALALYAIASAGRRASAATDGRPGATAHDFAFPGIEGGVLRLKEFAGRPVLVVNTASRCGFTHQYEGLQALYDRYREAGLVVLGVPSDDFGGQELDDEAAVAEFCEVNFGIDFPMTAITKVRGTAQHPFYAWAERTLGRANAPRWNFHKYLLDGGGRLVRAFGTGVDPMAPRVTDAISALLPANADG